MIDPCIQFNHYLSPDIQKMLLKFINKLHKSRAVLHNVGGHIKFYSNMPPKTLLNNAHGLKGCWLDQPGCQVKVLRSSSPGQAQNNVNQNLSLMFQGLLVVWVIPEVNAEYQKCIRYPLNTILIPIPQNKYQKSDKQILIYRLSHTHSVILKIWYRLCI